LYRRHESIFVSGFHHARPRRFDARALAATPPRRLHFACTGCGKCCDSPPGLGIRESFSYAEDFILAASIAFSPVPAEAFDLGLPTLRDARSGTTVQMLAVCRPLDRPGAPKCPALLDDGRCGIYEHRPLQCRVVPFDWQLAPGYVSRAPLWTEETGRPRDFRCDWSEAAPLAVDEKGVAEPGYADAYDKAREEARASKSALSLLPRDLVEQAWTAYRDRGALVSLNYMPMIAWGLAERLLDAPTAQRLVEAQVARIDAQVAAAVRRKDPAERATTALLRDFRGVYGAALRNGVTSAAAGYLGTR
jgi:Fe-S-cluster containining protein